MFVKQIKSIHQHLDMRLAVNKLGFSFHFQQPLFVFKKQTFPRF